MPPEENSVPEPAPAPVEATPAPDSTSSPQAETDPAIAEAMAGTQPATTTGQIPPNDPLPPVSDPIPSAQPAPEPPSSAAPAQTGILHTAPSVAKAMEGTRDLLVKARVSIQDRKRKKRDKIMEALTKKNPTSLKLRRAGEITNDEVEKLLHVSDATAERYLATLVKEGKIKQDRRTGAGVSYSRAP
ncbi:MAG: hypothetical protein NTU85_02330 [Candidatus Kaiserbacteria bacterium]|nr:hypothetical protein [Candidatus Kaiserbacteria bacterium]